MPCSPTFGTMRCGLPIALLLPVLCAAQPGPWWAYGFGGPADDRFTAIARGPGDTLYACGTFSGLMHCFTDQVISAGVTDIFLVKMDTAGTVYWTRTAGGPGVDRATDIAVDAAGNIFVTGQFSGTFTAGSTALTSNGPSQDIFLTKWNAAGQALWARAAGSTGNADIGEQVAVDAAGDCWVAGQFSGTAFFGGLSVTSTFDPLLNALGEDVFIARYTASGDPVWVKNGAAIHQDQALGLAVDATGNSWLGGQFSDVITFDQAHVNTLNNAAFVVAFDPAGNEQWFRRIGGGGSVLMGDLCHADGTLWICGAQTGNNLVFGNNTTAIASAYPYSAFAVGFNAQGEVAAQRTVGSDHPIEAKGIDVRGGEVLLGGNFACQALELSQLSGGDGLLLSWGGENGWACVLDLADGLSVTYAQMLADHQAMDLRGVVFGPGNAMFAVGEFADELIIPAIESKLRALPGDSLVMIGPGGADDACGDTTYYDVARLRSRGVLDGFLMKGFIRARRPMDIFLRTPCEFDLHPLFDVVPANEPDCTVPGFEASFCGDGALVASFDYSFGPLPQYVWSTGATAVGIPITAAGTYTAVGEVGPGCFSGTDAITVSLCEPVSLPGITDDQGINEQDTITQAVSVCQPQLVTLTAGPVPGISFTWIHPSGSFPGDTVITPEVDGVWYLQTVNAAGCAAVTTIQLSYVASDTLDEAAMDQGFSFPQDTDGNDTITICANEAVLAELSIDLFLDSAQTGSPGTFLLSDTVTVGGAIVDQGPYDMGSQPKPLSSAYIGDGWYVFHSLMHISDEPCNHHFANDVWQDSVYVTGIPGAIGAVDIVGSIFLCSGQSVTLTAAANGPGSFEWGAENGGIIGPNDTNTLTLIEAGPVQVIFTPQDTGACTLGDADSHSLTLVGAPSITMEPEDGLICPGDAVLLDVTGVTGTYEWYGPGGPLSQTSPSIQVSDAGTYFCVANTVEGCEYATALQTVSLYTTPYLAVLPQPVLCAGGSVQVSVQPPTGGTYAWAPPLTGNTASQTITAPGTYSVSVTQCGIVTPLSFTITQSEPVASIVDEGPFDICPQDSVLLQAAPGLVAYAWQPGNLTGQQVYATVEGDYSLIGFDEYGCTDTAYSALVEVHDFAQPVTASADTACAEETSTATASGSGAFNWYADADAQQAIGSGSPVTVGPFSGTTFIYVTQTDAECTSLPVPVEVVVVPGVVPTQITGDPIVCIGGTLTLNASPGVDLEWSTPLGDFSGPQVSQSPVATNANGTWTVTASQSGCINGTASVQVLVPDPQVAIVDNGPFEICPGDSVLLQATPGLAVYEWFPGGLDGQLTYAQDTGHFSVVGTDQYGCTDTAGLVTVDGFFYTLFLSADADEVCAGDTAIAIANGSGTLNWYADAALTQLLGSGPEWVVPGIAGPTTLYVTQTEAQCTSDAVAVPLPVIPLPPLPQIMGDVSLCTGDPLQLIVSPQFSPLWSTPAGPVTGFLVSDDYATPDLNGIYSVFLTNDGCAGPTASVEVSVVPLPLVDLGLPITLCIGATTVLDAGPALTWEWNTGSTAQAITVGVPGIYWVTILDAGGCTDTDSLLITQDDCEVDIPNFITPNHDGTNDVITLSSPSDAPLMLEIFNRWGQLLYTRTAAVVQWDGHNAFSGEEVPEGVYYYVLTARLVNGDPLVRTGYWQVVR
jgi:gliding motility-associated-like protein